MNFTKENYQTILRLTGHRITDFHKPGPGIVLRHDVDENIDKSYRCAEIESGLGIKSTYFILNTAPYWSELYRLLNLCRDIQGMGHEIGWHNNAITEHLETGKPVFDCILEPLTILRSAGLRITLTAGHGDPRCYADGYLNYNVFGYRENKDTMTYKEVIWDGYDGPVYKLSDFGLVKDASHDDYELFLCDSRAVWSDDVLPMLDRMIHDGKRCQLLIHPQHWDL